MKDTSRTIKLTVTATLIVLALLVALAFKTGNCGGNADTTEPVVIEETE